MKNFQLISYKDKYYWYTATGIVCAMYLLGFLSLRTIQSNSLAESLRAQIPFCLVLNAKANEAEVFDFQKKLRLDDRILQESIRFISRAEAMDELNQELAERPDSATQSQLKDIPNPLPDVIDLRLRPERFGELPALLAEWRANKLVADVWYAPALISDENAQEGTGFQRVMDMVTHNNLWLILLAAAIFFVGVALLRTTLRWHILAHGSLINNLALMGAPPDFVENLYFAAAWRAALASTLALWLLLGLTQILLGDSGGLLVVDASGSYILLYILIGAANIGVFILGTYRSTKDLKPML